MTKERFPTDAFGWDWLNKNPIKQDRTAEFTLGFAAMAILGILVAVSAVAYDQVRDARWNAELQATFDRSGS